VEEWFSAFLPTIVVEVPIVVVMLRRSEPDLARLAGIALFANLASHPAVWFVFTQLFLVGTPEYLVAAEGWAVAIEADTVGTGAVGAAVGGADGPVDGEHAAPIRIAPSSVAKPPRMARAATAQGRHMRAGPASGSAWFRRPALWTARHSLSPDASIIGTGSWIQ
jgi:hypothetical protein